MASIQIYLAGGLFGCVLWCWVCGVAAVWAVWDEVFGGVKAAMIRGWLRSWWAVVGGPVGSLEGPAFFDGGEVGCVGWRVVDGGLVSGVGGFS